jgi:predicted Rossmann-fold nucleotide-binding protein
MPGGFGTLDELFEAMTLIQTGKIKEFPVIIFCKDYHKDLLEHIERMKERKTISPDDMSLFLVTDSINEAIEHIRHSISRFGLKPYKPKPIPWLFEKKGSEN